jgi:hypothetical protein
MIKENSMNFLSHEALTFTGIVVIVLIVARLEWLVSLHKRNNGAANSNFRGILDVLEAHGMLDVQQVINRRRVEKEAEENG